MGIGIHELLFLKYCKKNKNFQTLSTLGRQEIYINKNDRFIKKIFTNYKDEKYADNLLITELNLSKLKSYDVSNEDNPSEIKNFNFIINSTEKVDAFFDGGSLQHTFNIPVVLKNISNHVKVGGSIIHISSANNLCGFGFYQFSPEFFINYYSNENGFTNTKVFVADYDNRDNWYEVKIKNFKSITINTTARLICMVVTEKKIEKDVKEILQNNYLFNPIDKENIKKKNLKNNILNSKIFISIYFKVLLLAGFFSNSISLRLNKNLTIKKIKKLLG